MGKDNECRFSETPCSFAHFVRKIAQDGLHGLHTYVEGGHWWLLMLFDVVRMSTLPNAQELQFLLSAFHRHSLSYIICFDYLFIYSVTRCHWAALINGFGAGPPNFGDWQVILSCFSVFWKRVL